MNVLSRDQQITRNRLPHRRHVDPSGERMTGIHRDTIMRLGAKVGRSCAELHDRMFVGIRAGRLELDELWIFVGKKQRHLSRTENHHAKGD